MKDNYGCVNCKRLEHCESNPFGICKDYDPKEGEEGKDE